MQIEGGDSDDSFPTFKESGAYSGEIMLVGKYVVFDCLNELEALETFHHFKQAEMASKEPME